MKNSGSDNEDLCTPQVSSVIPKKSCLVAAVVNNVNEDPFESQKSFHFSDEEEPNRDVGENTTSNVSPS